MLREVTGGGAQAQGLRGTPVPARKPSGPRRPDGPRQTM